MRSRTPPDLTKRCQRCFFLPEHCLCPVAQPVATRSEWWIVRHALEAPRTTNTARWAHLALERSQLLEFGGPVPFAWPPGALDGAALLFPTPHPTPPPAVPPRRVVVIDATWSQARKMVHRIPGLGGLPRLGLGPPIPGSPRLRVPPIEGGMSTIEAMAGGLELLGELDAAAHLDRVHDAAVARNIALSGKRPGVTG
jgi:DTW domain-containing protein YfiP